MLDLHVRLVASLALVNHPALIAAVQGRRVGLVLVPVPVVPGGKQFATQPAGGAAVAVQHVVQAHVGV